MNETINRLIAFERRSRWEEYISSINGHTPTGDLWKTIKRLTNKQPITTNLGLQHNGKEFINPRSQSR